MTDSSDGESDATPGPGENETARFTLAVRGALGFLSRLSVGTDRRAWEAFRRRPVAFVLVGYFIGALLSVPFLLRVPAPTVAILFPAVIVAVTGINHADGLADLGDAAAVHDASDDDMHDARWRVLKDSALGVGGTIALVLLVVGLVLAGLGLVALPRFQAVGVIVASEVSAKLGLALLACLGEAPFDGLGAQLTRVSTDQDLLGPTLVAVPAAFASWPSGAAGIALVAGAGTSLVTLWWANRALGGINGDVFGAANELARVVALHAGVVVWTLS